MTKQRDIVGEARSLCNEIAGPLDCDYGIERGSIEVVTVLVDEVKRLRSSGEPRDNIDFLQTWMRTPNPMLGDISPLDLCKMGLGHRLAQFIETAYEANQEST